MHPLGVGEHARASAPIGTADSHACEDEEHCIAELGNVKPDLNFSARLSRTKNKAGSSVGS
jgi:hypothetical protein